VGGGLAAYTAVITRTCAFVWTYPTCSRFIIYIAILLTHTHRYITPINHLLPLHRKLITPTPPTLPLHRRHHTRTLAKPSCIHHPPQRSLPTAHTPTHITPTPFRTLQTLQFIFVPNISLRIVKGQTLTLTIHQIVWLDADTQPLELDVRRLALAGEELELAVEGWRASVAAALVAAAALGALEALAFVLVQGSDQEVGGAHAGFVVGLVCDRAVLVRKSAFTVIINLPKTVLAFPVALLILYPMRTLIITFQHIIITRTVRIAPTNIIPIDIGRTTLTRLISQKIHPHNPLQILPAIPTSHLITHTSHRTDLTLSCLPILVECFGLAYCLTDAGAIL
jgi:hypothetical protein